MDSTAAATTRRPCFIEEEEHGLASLAEVEVGFSGNNHNNNHPFFSKSSSCYTRKNSLKNLNVFGAGAAISSPRSARFYDARFEDHHQQQPHFLQACFLCKKTLSNNRDIFMYRGDTPFCSEECRQEQIDIDEAKEKNWNISSSMKALRKKEHQRRKSTSSPTKNSDYSFRTGTIAAA